MKIRTVVVQGVLKCTAKFNLLILQLYKAGAIGLYGALATRMESRLDRGTARLAILILETAKALILMPGSAQTLFLEKVLVSHAIMVAGGG